MCDLWEEAYEAEAIEALVRARLKAEQEARAKAEVAPTKSEEPVEAPAAESEATPA